MKGCTGFWIGMGAGLMAGAAAGLMMPDSRSSMKTQTKKKLHQLEDAVDRAEDHMASWTH